MDEINVIFIHYHFPPIKNSGVYRNYFLSHALLTYSTSAHLITTSNQNMFPKEELPISDKLIQHVIQTLDYRTVAAWFKGKNNVTAGTQFSENTKSTLLFKWLIKLQRSFPFNLLIAEGALLYILSSYFKTVKIIKEQNINVVFSSFMPYADHISAWMIKMRFPGIVWVADFRDLHIEPIYKNTFWPDFQRKVEKFILKKADIVTTVSEGITSKMKVFHQNVHTITKGVDIRAKKDDFEIFTIHYSGSLFQEFRDPRPLFKALYLLIQNGTIDREKIRFLYAGKDGQLITKWAKECYISEIFECKGLISRADAIELQDKSHINLLLTTASDDHSGLLTGKLFEYIEAGKEILCLIKGSQDKEIEAMFDYFGLGSVLYDEESVHSYIQDKYTEWIQTGHIKFFQKRTEIYQEMSWQKQAEKIIKLVNRALKQKNGNYTQSFKSVD